MYNSVAKIALLEKGEEAPLLLATKGGHGGGELYNVYDIGIGASKTFSKSSVRGKKVGGSFSLNIQKAFADMPAAVKTVISWIETTYDAL